MKKYLPIFLVFISVGCELIVDVDVPFEKKSITANALINPDSLFSAQLSANRFILDDTEFQPIDNAQIIIYNSDSPIDTLISKGNGKYQSDTAKPEVGKRYDMRVVAEAYETVMGTSEIPMRAEILSAQISTSPIIDGQIENVLKIKFKDVAGQKNYYEVSMEVESEFYNPDVGIVYIRQPFPITQTNVAGGDDDFSTYGNGAIIRDILFDGKEVLLTFKVIPFYIPVGSKIVVNLKTLSEDYYRYYTTKDLQQNSSGDPLAQPVNVYNNINHGFGIFAGFTNSNFEFRTEGGGAAPIITGFAPPTGKPGDIITITGENFIGDNADINVSFKTFSSQVLTVSNNEIQAVVPSGATSGKIVVYVNGRVVVSESDFLVIE